MMTRTHPSGEEIELYAIGALDAVKFEDIESHFKACERCAGALEGQARLDFALERVAESFRTADALPPVLDPPVVLKPRRSFLGFALGAGTMAAACAIAF